MIPRTRTGMVWRFLLAAVVIIGAAAATTAVAGLLQVGQLVNDIPGTDVLTNADVTLPPAGAPQTLLLIGSDHRKGTSYRKANTDTMMLVRVDPNSSTINVLSIPRDLEVQVPGYGTQKVNSAYSLGGPNLMLKTIQQNVFPHLKINHILDVNFQSFSDLVDAIGCVYGQVDRRYYNNTAYTGYSSINIQPGYQKLCGDNQSESGALAFVRFRHTDTDLVRNARQQDFIRWAKAQYSTTQLLNNKDRLLHTFARHLTLDANLRSTDGLLNLFDLLINADGHTIKSIPFPAILNNCPPPPAGQAPAPCYVNATSSAEARAFRAFMRVSKPAAAKAATTGAAAKTPAKSLKGPGGPPPGLVSDVSDAHGQASQLTRVGFPVYYPKLKLAGAEYCSALAGNCDDPQQPAWEYNHSYPRFYSIHDRSGGKHAAYYMTLVVNSLKGEYYGIQGTTWLNPPLLQNPQATKVVDGKKLYLYAEGGRLTTVAYRTPTAVYWIANTLTNTISNQQMVAIAASLTRLP